MFLNRFFQIKTFSLVILVSCNGKGARTHGISSQKSKMSEIVGGFFIRKDDLHQLEHFQVHDKESEGQQCKIKKRIHDLYGAAHKGRQGGSLP